MRSAGGGGVLAYIRRSASRRSVSLKVIMCCSFYLLSLNISLSFLSMSSPRNPRAMMVPSGAKRIVSGISVMPYRSEAIFWELII